MTTEALAMPDPKKNTVLVPQQAVVGRISPFHTVGWTIIQLDKETETYPIKGGGLGLSKSALNKIASAAGLRVLTSRQVGEITPDHLIWQVEVELPLANAKPVRGIGTKEWMKGVGKDGNDLEHRITKTETKATLRAIRQVLGVRTKYTDDEITRPIAVPHIDYNPDLDDAGVRDVMRQRALIAESDLFGNLPDDDDDDAMPEPEIIAATANDGGEEAVNAATGEVIEDAEFVVVPEATAEDALLHEQRDLQGYKLSVATSPFNGWSFADIWLQEDGGRDKWFTQVAAWAAKKGEEIASDEATVDFVIKAARFFELVQKNGGELV